MAVLHTPSRAHAHAHMPYTRMRTHIRGCSTPPQHPTCPQLIRVRRTCEFAPPPTYPSASGAWLAVAGHARAAFYIRQAGSVACLCTVVGWAGLVQFHTGVWAILVADELHAHLHCVHAAPRACMPANLLPASSASHPYHHRRPHTHMLSTAPLCMNCCQVRGC